MADRIILAGQDVPDQVIARIREVLGAGGIIVYPTDTFYALGADPGNDASVRRLFLIKERQADQPILLLIADRTHVARWSGHVNASAVRLMDRFWPGPLTLVLTARADVSAALTCGSGKIGLRLPGNVLTRALLAGVGGFLTGTSANRSGEPAPRTADAVLATMGHEVDLVLDGGPAQLERPSTVIDVSRDEPVIIRHGAIDAEHLL